MSFAMDYFLSENVNWDPIEIVAHYTNIYPIPASLWHALRQDLERLAKSTSFTPSIRHEATKLLETWKVMSKFLSVLR